MHGVLCLAFSLSIIIWKFIQIVTCIITQLLSMAEEYAIFFPFITLWTYGWYLNFKDYCNITMNIHVRDFVWTHIFSFIKIYLGLELLDNSVFNVLRTCQTVFHSSCTIFHSHQQCMKIPNSAHPCQNLLFVHLFIIAILVGMK